MVQVACFKPELLGHVSWQTWARKHGFQWKTGYGRGGKAGPEEGAGRLPWWVQWLRMRLPMQGTRVRYLVRELRSHRPRGSWELMPWSLSWSRNTTTREGPTCCNKDSTQRSQKEGRGHRDGGSAKGERSGDHLGGGGCPSTPSFSRRPKFLVLTLSISFPQIHHQERPESVCPAEGRMGAKTHFKTQSPATTVTWPLNFRSKTPGSGSALGSAVLWWSLKNFSNWRLYGSGRVERRVFNQSFFVFNNNLICSINILIQLKPEFSSKKIKESIFAADCLASPKSLIGPWYWILCYVFVCGGKKKKAGTMLIYFGKMPMNCFNII